MIYLGAQNDPEIGPLGPIFNTPLKLTCTPRLMWNQWKFFEKMTKDRNFDLFGGPKWPRNWASEVHILHTYKSTWNEHVKQYCCETSENFLRKWPNTDLSYFGAQNGPEIGPLRGTYFTRLWQQLQCAYKARLMWIQGKLFNKIFENLNFDSFGGPKIWASEASLLHSYKSNSNELVNQVSSEYSWNVSRK